MFPSPPSMMRNCADPVTFVQNNGIAAYRKDFNSTVTPEMLAADEYYEENCGPRVTKQHISNFIRYWGIEYYIANCSPESTYAEMMTDEDFIAAQTMFYCKPVDEAPPCIRYARQIPDPYYRKLRDPKGVLVPESTDTTDAEYDVDKEYIYMHGIVNYILFSNCKIPMTTLLASRSIAIWQRCYIDNFKY